MAEPRLDPRIKGRKIGPLSAILPILILMTVFITPLVLVVMKYLGLLDGINKHVIASTCTVIDIVICIFVYFWIIKKGHLIEMAKAEIDIATIEQLKKYRRNGVIMFCILCAGPIYIGVIYELVKYYCL